MRNRCMLWLIAATLGLSLTSCGGQSLAEPAVTSPAISVQITKDICPSIEVQAGVQIAWTNLDTVDHVVLIERMDAQGNAVNAGGIDRLSPGASFSTTLEAGQYTYYCFADRSKFGTINVIPASYPYP